MQEKLRKQRAEYVLKTQKGRDRTQQIDNQESRSITSGSSGQFCLKTNREKNGSELTRIHNITAAFLPEDGMYWQIYLNFRSSEKAGK